LDKQTARQNYIRTPIENGKNRDNKGKFVSGNTASVGKGRPKGSQSIPDILKKIGDEEGTQDGKTKLDVIMYKVFQFALEGKPWAVQFIADRTEGKALERVQTQEVHDELIIE